ncbi:hypothetical protein NE237_000987 [Protea cynaroides]|uniref:Uncharacterized protein n=1 Tax=Protea cynaroides TaxID=273540 RepID=A0A9Q0KSH9_9MAGN|nr:hypothetical protein NE237_000987 [Protea cynaroides]
MVIAFSEQKKGSPDALATLVPTMTVASAACLEVAPLALESTVSLTHPKQKEKEIPPPPKSEDDMDPYPEELQLETAKEKSFGTKIYITAGATILGFSENIERSGVSLGTSKLRMALGFVVLVKASGIGATKDSFDFLGPSECTLESKAVYNFD